MTQYEKMSLTPVPKLILKLSLPAVISMLVNNIYNLVDTAFVGTLGTSASGAVGIVFGFMAVIQAFGFMYGQGSGSIISRLLGKKDTESASDTATAGVLSSFISGLVISIVSVIFLDRIVYLLGSTETIAPYAKTYITYIIIAAPFMASSLTMNNILRYEGKASLGMAGLMTGAVINMIGDPILMFGLRMEIAGAGLSTALSQIISWCILMYMFLSGRTESKLRLSSVRKIRPGLIWNIASTGFPSLIRQILNSFTTVLLNSLCAPYGDAAVAAMSIVSRIMFFSFSIALGIGQGFQPVAGFSYGAGKYDRLKKAFRFTLIISETIMIAVCSLILIFSGSLIRLFRDDPEVIRIGTRALILHAVAFAFLPLCSCTEMLHQSTGRRVAAVIVSSMRSGAIFIPVLIILSSLRGLSGIQEAQPLATLLSVPVAVPFAVRFFSTLGKKEKDRDQNSE